jgi:4-diphosphocytidyl-2-C-methyl-D-erythritol kinase
MFSPAKVNLYLRILGQRPDGYHELETVMLPLDFGDEITLRPLDSGLVLECDNPSLPTDDSNLALRAAKRLAERCGGKRGARITLTKRTPLAAGLGGGSSNAAAVLLGLRQLWGLEADDSILHQLAASLGSDVNFFLVRGAALCRGRGEQVEAAPCKLSTSVLLVNPGFGISTKWAYENWGKAAPCGSRLTASPPEVSLLLQALAKDDPAGVSRCLFNSLEAPSIRKFPVLRLIKDVMRSNGASGTLMSGSGATVFGLFDAPRTAEKSAREVREQFGPSMWTRVTRFAYACPEPLRG